MTTNDYIYSVIKVLYSKLSNINNYSNLFQKVERQYPAIQTDKMLYSYIDDPSYIIDNIYLGNAYNAANYNLLKKLNIKIIINITSDIPNYFKNDNNFTYINYNIKDINNSNIKEFLLKSYLVLSTNNNNILIHCYAGSSRSASIILYYLIKHYNQSFEEANSFLKSKRDIVNINTTYINEIKKLCNV